MSNDLTTAVLRLRDSTASRVALRRGTSPVTEHYAYPWLAHYWSNEGVGWMRLPLLRFASLAAHSRLRDDPELRLGAYLRLVAEASGRSNDRRSHIERKLLLVQAGDIEKLHQVLRTVMSVKKGPNAVSWASVWDAYRLWDHPVLEVRTRVRRRLLDDFYRPIRIYSAELLTVDTGASARPREQMT